MPSVLGDWSDSFDHLVHLLVAFVLALPIGWNRARAERSAGLRTFPLVAMASCGLVQTAVIGVGFIGAGAIIRQGDITTGNATAASVWVVGIIGAAVGYGYYDIGIILAAANLAVLLIRARVSANSPAPAGVSEDERPAD